MINILEINPNPNDAMSLYRGRGPLIRLQKKYSNELNFYPAPQQLSTDWDHLNIYDLVFIMRPSSDTALNIIKACNSYGIPVWADYDDLLSDIPKDNPAYFVEHNSPRYKARLEEIMARCAFVTFSTQHLMNTMGKNVYQKSTVIPNGIDKKLFSSSRTIGIENKILWRGGSTHSRDIYEFRDPIIRSIRKSGYVLELMGLNPIYITDFIDGIYTPYMNKSNYFNYLSRYNGKISIVPLSHRPEEIEFNKSKSNIAWIESTYAGLATLAPDWEEWRKPGIINYTDANDFHKKLTAMINGEYDLESHRLASWRYIRQNLDIEVLNEKRYALIKECLSKV
jgi:hypothetical protein